MTSYLEVYAREIAPRFKAIDLTLKSGEDIDVAEAARLLDISEHEIEALCSSESGNITPPEFLSLMTIGSSAVCGLYRRELERKSPITYTASDISYIYDIDSSLVQAAFEKLHATEVTEYALIKVFAEICV